MQLMAAFTCKLLTIDFQPNFLAIFSVSPKSISRTQDWGFGSQLPTASQKPEKFPVCGIIVRYVVPGWNWYVLVF
jgi:hypothetical protein